MRQAGNTVSNSLKINGAEKHFSASIPPDLARRCSDPWIATNGAFVLDQIKTQESWPVSFTTPHGERIKIWTSDRKDRKGEEVYWAVNLKDLKKAGEKRCGFSEPRKATPDIIRAEGNSHVPLTRLKPNPPARDPAYVQPDIWPRPWGYKVRVLH
jgi:hypothetical protein